MYGLYQAAWLIFIRILFLADISVEVQRSSRQWTALPNSNARPLQLMLCTSPPNQQLVRHVLSAETFQMSKRRLTLYSAKLTYIANAILDIPEMFIDEDIRRSNKSFCRSVQNTATTATPTCQLRY
jgi:hypothetical protein